MELSEAIAETNWPSVVANEHCDVPFSVGEDYSGAKCTGVTIAAARLANCHMPATVGEDYRGATCDPAAGDQTTIVLQLKFTNGNVRPSIQVLTASGPPNSCRPALVKLCVSFYIGVLSLLSSNGSKCGTVECDLHFDA